MSTENEESAKPVNVLFFIQDPRVIEMATIQLEKAGHKIFFARTTIEAFAQIQNCKPDVILISWNLKKVNVKTLYTHFTEKLGALVVVFSELNDPMTTMKLNNSGIQNTLFPPLSGPGIQLRIQILLKKHKEKGAHLNKSDDIGFKSVKKESVPTDTTWDKVAAEGKTEAGDKTALWKGTSQTKKDKLYFFESEQTPQQIFVSTTGGPDKKQSDLLFVETDHSGEKLLSAIQGAKAGKDFSVTAGLNKANLNPILSLLEKILKKAVTDILPSSQKPQSAVNIVSTALILPINTSRFKGYIVVTQSQNKTDIKTVSDVNAELKKLLLENGETIIEDSAPFEAQFDQIQFQNWIEKKANFSLSGQKDSNEITFSFVERDRFPHIVEVKDENFYGTKMEGLLVENSSLTFDLYLHMPKNKKYLLYVKKKRLITEKVIQKLDKYKVENVYFEKADKDNFFQYSAVTYLKFKP